MSNYIFDESTNLVIVYTVYEGSEICVDSSECYYDFSDIQPSPSDFDLKTEQQLNKYLEDIVYEHLEAKAEQDMDERYEDDRVWAKHYAGMD